MWYVILVLLIAIYAVVNLVLPQVLSGFATFIAQPILWALLAFLTFKISRGEGLNIWFRRVRKWRFGDNPAQAALLIASLQIAMLVTAGVFYKFGKSPYSFSPLGILMNMFFVGAMLLGMELSRAYLIRRFVNRRNTTLVLTLTAMLFAFMSISPAKFGTLGFENPAGSAEFIGGTCIPALAQNLLASLLAFFGGAIASIAYLGTLKAFEWFCPILPDLHWTVKALIATITPAIGFLAIQQSLYAKERAREKRKRKESPLGWTATAILSVIIIWFAFGFFPVHPAVVGSGSMRPLMNTGDVAIIINVPIDAIKQGDIIQFRAKDGHFTIMHRVVEIKHEGNTKLFVTKGDANKDIDPEPVHPSQITGKVVFVIPKVGWVGIIIRDFIKSIAGLIWK